MISFDLFKFGGKRKMMEKKELCLFPRSHVDNVTPIEREKLKFRRYYNSR